MITDTNSVVSPRHMEIRLYVKQKLHCFNVKIMQWLFVLEQYAEFGLLFVLQWEYSLQLLKKYSSFSTSIILTKNNSKRLPWAVFSCIKSIFQSSTYYIDPAIVKIFMSLFSHSGGKGNIICDIIDNQEQCCPTTLLIQFQQLLIFGCVKKKLMPSLMFIFHNFSR